MLSGLVITCCPFQGGQLGPVSDRRFSKCEFPYFLDVSPYSISMGVTDQVPSVNNFKNYVPINNVKNYVPINPLAAE